MNTLVSENLQITRKTARGFRQSFLEVAYFYRLCHSAHKDGSTMKKGYPIKVSSRIFYLQYSAKEDNDLMIISVAVFRWFV